MQREHTPPADGLDQEFPADDDATEAIRSQLATLIWVDSAWQERRWQCAILLLLPQKRTLVSRRSKAAKRHKPTSAMSVSLKKATLLGATGGVPSARMQLPGFLGVTKTAADEYRIS